MDNTKKKIAIFLLIFIVGSITGIIGYSNTKVTTFEECKNSWLLSSIAVYDYIDANHDGPDQKCRLWTGKNFLKYFPFFPTQKEPATVYNQALLSGIVEEIDGCLRVNGDLIVWPYGFSLITDEKGITQVIDSAHKTVVRTGDKVRFGGGGFSEDEMDIIDILSNLSAELPNDRCPGPYWIVGEVIIDNEPNN